MRNFALVCALALTQALLTHGRSLAEIRSERARAVSDMAQTVLFMREPIEEE